MNTDEGNAKLSDHQRRALERFRDLEITLEEFRSLLRGRVDFNFEGSAIYTRMINKKAAPAEPGVPVNLQQMRSAYHKFKSGKVSEKDLSNWAAMLLMNDDCCFDEAEEELIAEWLNPIAAFEPVPNIDPC